MTPSRCVPGLAVRLNTPENVRLHGAAARVVTVTEWGAHVATAAAATGRFRALFAEMDDAAPAPQFTGDFCAECGSSNMTRAGTCLVCRNCGSTSGGC